MPKPKLTRRVMRQYRNIINQNEHLSQYWQLPRLPVTANTSSRGLFGYTHQQINGFAALHFAKKWKGRDIDLKKLERIVAQSGDASCMAEFALNIPGANVKRLQKAAVKTLNPEGIRRFMAVPGARTEYLKSLLIIIEVMKD